jgi:hypothetical protein
MKTRDLTSPALDWAVAKCEGETWVHYFSDEWSGPLHYSTDWSQGGTIIEREKLSVVIQQGNPPVWHASCPRYASHGYGHTPLIAAMRCYVASKLGDEVEIPEELK